MITTCMLLSSVAVFAESNIWDYEEFKIKENPNIVESYDIMANETKGKQEVAISKADIDAEFDKIAKKFNKDKKNFTDKKREKALKLIEDLQENNVIESQDTISIQDNNMVMRAAATSDYDSNKAKLRAANFIEAILNVEEGMSTWEIYKVGVTHANKARDEALKEFPKTDYTNVMLRDAFRHFSWNNMSTKDIGAYKTRTATINHEWGILLLDPMTNYFDARYNEYVGQGYSDAGNRALTDTVLYIPTAKYHMVSLCKGSYNFFKSFFDESNIMDLHNNCWGRAYAGNYPSLSYRDAFYRAKNNNELILAENKVTNANFDYVWRSQWYTY